MLNSYIHLSICVIVIIVIVVVVVLYFGCHKIYYYHWQQQQQHFKLFALKCCLIGSISFTFNMNKSSNRPYKHTNKWIPSLFVSFPLNIPDIHFLFLKCLCLFPDRCVQLLKMCKNCGHVRVSVYYILIFFTFC